MSAFMQRLFEEKRELGRRAERLKTFITSVKYNDLPEIDRKDLVEQLGYMDAYLSVLSRRCSRLCG